MIRAQRPSPTLVLHVYVMLNPAEPGAYTRPVAIPLLQKTAGNRKYTAAKTAKEPWLQSNRKPSATFRREKKYLQSHREPRLEPRRCTQGICESLTLTLTVSGASQILGRTTRTHLPMTSVRSLRAFSWRYSDHDAVATKWASPSI